VLKILRLEQWAKNLVIFIPAVLAKNYEVFWNSSIYLVFLAFSIIVSSTYIFNDLIDLEQDKIHPQKKRRPLASGNLSKKSATILAICLSFIGFILIFLLEKNILFLVLAYVVITMSYSVKLKYIKYFDFISITILFTIRLLLGAVTTETSLSNFFLVFVLLFLTIISIGKKLSIYTSSEINDSSRVKAHLKRSYSANELEKILKVTFILSNITYFLWSYDRIFNNGFNFMLSMLALFLIAYLGIRFIKDSKLSKTENFISWIMISKMYVVGFIISSIVLFVTFNL
jgi:decaprenyl-phosphate phosphoribosyltransferase